MHIPSINPDPALLGGADNLVRQILGLVMYLSLVVCVVAGLASGGMIAVGGLSRNVDLCSSGTRGLLYSIAGVIVIGTVLVVLDTAFSRAHG